MSTNLLYTQEELINDSGDAAKWGPQYEESCNNWKTGMNEKDEEGYLHLTNKKIRFIIIAMGNLGSGKSDAIVNARDFCK